MANRPVAPPAAPDWPVHPGKLLAEELAARTLTQKALAAAMARPPRLVNEIVRGKKAITAETALQLERVLGTPAHIWLGLQCEYELARARATPGILEHVHALPVAAPTRSALPARARHPAVAETRPRYRARL